VKISHKLNIFYEAPVFNYLIYDREKNITPHLVAFITTLVSLFIVYGFEITHFTVSIDEDTLDNFNHTLYFGRWGHTFFKNYIFPEPWAPFFSMFFCFLMVSSTSVICCDTLRLSKKDSFIFSVLFCALPQLAYQLQFSNQDETTGLALFFSSLAGWLSLKGGVRNVLLSTLLYLATLSIYQSYVFFGACLVTLKLFKDGLEDGISFKRWMSESLKVIASLIMAIALYLIISRQVKIIFGIAETSYFSDLIMWEPLGFFGGIKNSLNFIMQRYTYHSNYGLNIFFVVIFFAMHIIYSAIRKHDFQKLPLPLFLVFVVLLSPFFMNVLIANGSPARTLSQMPLIFAGVITLSFSFMRNNFFKIAVSILFLLIGCAASSQMFYSDYFSEKQNTVLSQNAIQDIYRNYPDFNNSEDKVLFYGKMNLKNPWRKWDSNDFGVSFFERGDGNRIINYINGFGVGELIPVSNPESIANFGEVIKSMPTWPNDGGIRKVDNNIIVKLSD